MAASDGFGAFIGDRAYGKGTFGGLKPASEFAEIVHNKRDTPEFAPLSKEKGHVDVGEKRAAVVTRYRSGSITETHLNPDGSLGKHGAYHYSARSDTVYALKEGGKPEGKALRSTLV